MRALRKKSKFGDSNSQKFYIEKFDNYGEFLSAINRRQDDAYNKKSSISFGSFVGASSWEEIDKMLINGWDSPVPDMKKMFDEKSMKVSERNRRVQFSSVQGYAPIVAHAVMNLPNSMIDCRQEKRKTKILNFVIMIDRACSVEADEIKRKMSEQLAGIARLERDLGYRCRISVAFAAFGDCPDDDETYVAAVVKIKDESQPFDIKRVAFPIVHPAMLRAYMFAWEGTLTSAESLGESYWSYHQDGLGKSFEHWRDRCKKQFSDVVSDGEEKVIILDFLSDFEESIKEIKGGREVK